MTTKSTRRRGTNSPLKTLICLLIIGGLGYAAYANRDKLQELTKGSEPPPASQVTRLSGLIDERLAHNDCVEGLRTQLLWRQHEQRWRLDILLFQECETEARGICTEIAEMLQRETGKPASVWGYDATDRVLAKVIL